MNIPVDGMKLLRCCLQLKIFSISFLLAPLLCGLPAESKNFLNYVVSVYTLKVLMIVTIKLIVAELLPKLLVLLLFYRSDSLVVPHPIVLLQVREDSFLVRLFIHHSICVTEEFFSV